MILDALGRYVVSEIEANTGERLESSLNEKHARTVVGDTGLLESVPRVEEGPEGSGDAIVGAENERRLVAQIVEEAEEAEQSSTIHSDIDPEAVGLMEEHAEMVFA